jgi:hypothetical protein
MYVDEPVTEENTNIPELLNYLFTLIGSKKKLYRNKQPIMTDNEYDIVKTIK